jgi:RNA-binding protein Musashi
MGRANVPNAPRGPAAMRGSGGETTPQGQNGGGAGAQRYSTQGNARAKPY